MRKTTTARGFTVYGDELGTDYGHVLRVQQSSAALREEGTLAWLFVEVPKQWVAAFLEGDRSVGVHMTPDQVRGLRDRLDAFLAEHSDDG